MKNMIICSDILMVHCCITATDYQLFLNMTEKSFSSIYEIKVLKVTPVSLYSMCFGWRMLRYRCSIRHSSERSSTTVEAVMKLSLFEVTKKAIKCQNTWSGF